jgi:hypothetical protein
LGFGAVKVVKKLSEKGCEQRSNREIDRYKEHEKGLLGAP